MPSPIPSTRRLAKAPAVRSCRTGARYGDMPLVELQAAKAAGLVGGDVGVPALLATNDCMTGRKCQAGFAGGIR